MHPSTMKDSPAQRAGRAAFHAHMIKKLAKKPWIADYREDTTLSDFRRLIESMQSSLSSGSLVGGSPPDPDTWKPCVQTM